MNLSAITHSAGELSKKTGMFILSESRKFNVDTVEQKSFNQLVSYVDKTAEEMLVKGLMQILPEAGFITEEETIKTENRPYMWVIDPLDGTTNFVHGLPIYSVSIGLLKNNEPIAGIIYEPNRDELFYAWQKGGAYLNGERISVKVNDSLAKSLLATGFPYYDFERVPLYLDTLKELLRTTRGMRRMGSAAVDLAYVACGRFDGFFEYGLNPWDVAGGILIVQEAGGLVSTFSGKGTALFDGEIIASSSALYDSFSRVIRNGFNLNDSNSV